MEDNGKLLLFNIQYIIISVYSQYQWYNYIFIRNKIN